MIGQSQISPVEKSDAKNTRLICNDQHLIRADKEISLIRRVIRNQDSLLNKHRDSGWDGLMFLSLKGQRMGRNQ